MKIKVDIIVNMGIFLYNRGIAWVLRNWGGGKVQEKLIMESNYEDNLFYVCTMIEYVARETHNQRRDVVARLSDSALKHQLKAAGINHCLPFEQVCDEWIKEYDINKGSFDNIAACKYNVPSVTAIGRVYQRLILDTKSKDGEIEAIKAVFSSFISDEISDFNSNVYYSNPDYLRCSYEEGFLLD